MNELDLIRSFRADVPGPSVAATARAARAWQPVPRRRRRWAPRIAAATAVAAAVAAAALIIPSGDDGRLGAERAAAGTLRQAAVKVTGLPRPLEPGEFWFVRSKTLWTTAVEGKAGAYTAMGLETREQWTGADGLRRWTTRQIGPLRFPSARDQGRWEADGRPRLVSPPSVDRMHTSFSVGVDRLGYRRLLALPRDPRALYERFRAAAVKCRCGNGVDDQTFVVATDLLRDAPLPTAQRAAILRAIALIPGIEQQAERDVLGRPGVGVAYEGTQGRQALIFDPASYRLLGERSGAGGSADLETGIVGSETARP